MISFYPGPSRVYDEIPRYVADAHKKGILGMNHRSEAFVKLSKKTIGLLRKKMDVPADFTIFFTTSATECWEVISQSLVKRQSVHYFNGAFGEKWFDYAKKIHPKSQAIRFSSSSLPNTTSLERAVGEVICLTQNETSNGTQVSNEFIGLIQRQHKDQLIAVDATSSMGGIHLDFALADIWFASVQKCFGLPAGLGVLFLSPRAMDRISTLGENKHYNSLTLMAAMISRWQTPCTPNVLAIYLLMRTLKKRPGIAKISRKIGKRAEDWYFFFSESGKLTPLHNDPEIRSLTVLSIQSDPALIAKIKTKALTNGLLLGEGYGTLKHNTFRIANFPAIRPQEIKLLKTFLTPYL